MFKRDAIRIRQQIYDMVDDHIQFANSILQMHKFSIGIGNRKSIRLIAKRIKVMCCDDEMLVTTIFYGKVL